MRDSLTAEMMTRKTGEITPASFLIPFFYIHFFK